MSKSVYIVAVENSADHLGAELIQQIKAETPHLSCLGIGGAAMTEQGVISEIDISGLAILGFIEGMKSCLLYTSPSPRDRTRSRMPSSA